MLISSLSGTAGRYYGRGVGVTEVHRGMSKYAKHRPPIALTTGAPKSYGLLQGRRFIGVRLTHKVIYIRQKIAVTRLTSSKTLGIFGSLSRWFVY